MTPGLSSHTRQLVEILFRPEDAAEAARWLEEECGNNLPFWEDRNEYELERIRFAALKVSNGTIRELLKAIDLARVDWRDLLMWAGFGNNVKAHERWFEEITKKT